MAVMLLAGERMGFSMSNADGARALLEGRSVHAMTSAAISNEATALHNQIRLQPELVNQANSHCDSLMAEYGLAAEKAVA